MLRGHETQPPCFVFFIHSMVVRMPDATSSSSQVPTFPMNVAVTVSASSVIASGSAARRRGAGPNRTFALSRGSYSELWQAHLNTSLSPDACFTQPVTGHPVCEQISE